MGRSDLYRVRRRNGGYGEVESLGAPINSALSQPDLYVSPDGEMIIFAQTDHPEGHGGDDLWVAFRDGASWTEPRNLGPAVNTSDYEYGPTVHGEYLYFTSHGFGSADVYRVRLSELEALRR